MPIAIAIAIYGSTHRWPSLIHPSLHASNSQNMAHLTKATDYDIEDSNIALLGSDVSLLLLSLHCT